MFIKLSHNQYPNMRVSSLSLIGEDLKIRVNLHLIALCLDTISCFLQMGPNSIISPFHYGHGLFKLSI